MVTLICTYDDHIHVFTDKNPLLTPVLDEECCVRGHEVIGSSDG